MCRSAGQGGGQHIAEAGGLASAITAAITTTQPAPQAAGPVPVANALRAEIPALTMLSDGERHVLAEWLDRIVTATGSGSGS